MANTQIPGVSIQLILPQGTADGVTLAKIPGWTGCIASAPASGRDQLAARPKCDRAGVHLFFLGDDSGGEVVHIRVSSDKRASMKAHWEQSPRLKKMAFITDRDDSSAVGLAAHEHAVCALQGGGARAHGNRLGHGRHSPAQVGVPQQRRLHEDGWETEIDGVVALIEGRYEIVDPRYKVEPGVDGAPTVEQFHTGVLEERRLHSRQYGSYAG